MKKKKIMLVFGTRPEAIKMAPLYHALNNESSYFEPVVCVTGQHREMLDQVLNIFEIVPDIDLNLMEIGQDLFDVTSLVLLGMRGVLESYKPDLMLVHGDTTTTFAASLSGFYANVPVGHVEAGLRTNNIYSPYPEEFNRQVSSILSELHFAPTSYSYNNLMNEGISSEKVLVTGNTVIDSLFWALDQIENNSDKLLSVTEAIDKVLNFQWQKEKFVLITGHRRENLGKGLINICKAIKESATRYPDIHFVFPMHLNPNVRMPVVRLLDGVSNIHLIEPLEYEQFIYLLKHCYIILTDSGGIQEEAPSLGKPVLVMRDVTERPEGIESNAVRLVGTQIDSINKGLGELVENKDAYNLMSKAHNPYGDGSACLKIITFLKAYYEFS